jgi:hypothetical protein
MRPKDCSLCAKINKKPQVVWYPGQVPTCHPPKRLVLRMELWAILNHLRLPGTLNDKLPVIVIVQDQTII